MFTSLFTVKYKPCIHTLSTHTSHSFLQLSESATIKGFCHKKLLCESYYHSPLMPQHRPTQQSTLETDTTVEALILRMDWVFLFLTACYLIRKTQLSFSLLLHPHQTQACSHFSERSNHRIKAHQSVLYSTLSQFPLHFTRLLEKIIFMLTIANFSPPISAGSCLAKWYLGSTITTTFVTFSLLYVSSPQIH